MRRVLYRTSSGEVLKITQDIPSPQTFADIDPLFWTVLTDPVLTDGFANKSVLGADLGPSRELGFQKHFDGASVRNAIQSEIDGYQALQESDEAIEDVDEAQKFIDTHPRLRRVFKALLKRLIAEINADRAQWETFRGDVASASNMAQLKASVASYTTRPQRTLSQAINALIGDLDAGD